jgi:hypothetical protein
MRVDARNTVYMIVYSTNSKMLRRVIVAEHDWHYFDGWRQWLAWLTPRATRFHRKDAV